MYAPLPPAVISVVCKATPPHCFVCVVYAVYAYRLLSMLRVFLSGSISCIVLFCSCPIRRRVTAREVVVIRWRIQTCFPFVACRAI